MSRVTENDLTSKRRNKGRAIIARYSRWVRLYSSVRNDPKILAMTDRQRWQWVCLLMVAGETDDGILPTSQSLAIELRTTVGEVADLIDDLVLRGLLDIVRRDGCTVVVKPHNWDHRQFVSDRSGAERVRRHRERRQRSNVTETQMQRYRSDSAYDSVLVDRTQRQQEVGDGSSRLVLGDTGDRYSTAAVCGDDYSHSDDDMGVL